MFFLRMRYCAIEENENEEIHFRSMGDTNFLRTFLILVIAVCTHHAIHNVHK